MCAADDQPSLFDASGGTRVCVGSARVARARVGRARGVATGAVVSVLSVLSPSIASADVIHVVAKGHTIATIAGRYHVSSKSITDANPNANPKRLRIGETLTIPGVTPKAGAPKAGEKAASARTSEAQAKAAPPGKAPGQASASAHAGAGAAPAPASAPHASPTANAAAPKGPHGKDAYTAKPKHPNVVHLVRFGTSEEASVNVSSRGKVPPAAIDQLKKLMHSSSGQTHTPDARLVALLGIVSNHFGGKKIEIISGFRPFSPKQYTPHSNHNHGRAMDFRVQGVPNTVLRDYCRTLHDVGVGYYPNSVFVHLDVRSAPAFWIDYSKPGEAPRYHAASGATDADEGTSDVHAEHPGLNTQTPTAPTEAPASAPPSIPAPGASSQTTPATPASPAAPAVEKPAEVTPPKVVLPVPTPGSPSLKP